MSDHKLVPVVKHYIEGMESFCKRNFGTTDLEKCRQFLRSEYREIWEKY